MVDRRHHLRRALTVLAGAVGAWLALFTLAPSALAACEEAKQQADKPGRCVERDGSGRCTIWFDGQIYLGSGNRLPVDKEPLPPDRLELYALVSPCNGGPPPPNQSDYDCVLGEDGEAERWEQFQCDEDRPNARLYQIWSRYYDEDEPEWQPSTEWEAEPWACLTPKQGAAHDYLPADQPWITYIASYPGGNLKTDPAGGRTLIGLQTNFYSEVPKEIRYTAEHHSGEVQMCVEPTEWVWDFDDGERAVTPTPGAPYPNMQVTHTYTEDGNYEPSVSIRYSRYLYSENGWTTNDLLHDSLPGTGSPLQTMELVPRLISPADPP